MGEVEPIVAQAAAGVPGHAGARRRGAGGRAPPSAGPAGAGGRADRAAGRPSGWCASVTGSAARWRSCSTAARWTSTRLAQEIAFQADRLDITEELVRFRAHVAAVREALAERSAGRASSSASWRRSSGAR